MSAEQVPVIGIIGGVGSGKTAIANALRSFLTVCLLDADRIGHEVLKQQSVKDELTDIFGIEIIDYSGDIHRPKLAALVFGKEERFQSARNKLNEITHPRIRQFLEKEIAQFKDQRACDVIILDAALLLEAGWAAACDAIVYLEVPERIRLQRVQQRGWSEQQFLDREESQVSLQIKFESAAITIKNDGNLESAAAELAEWIQKKFLNRSTEPINTPTEPQS